LGKSLWRDQGKVQQARDLLAPVYSWSTEGFDTRDLKEAKALLEEVAVTKLGSCTSSFQQTTYKRSCFSFGST
jgi:hypothetical protein